MKSILGGIVLMVLLGICAGFLLQNFFKEPASSVSTSQNGSVRLEEK